VSHRSKRKTRMVRCKVCGQPSYYLEDERTQPCPYKALHRAAQEDAT
jgi:ribosomal protein L37E